MYQLNCISCTYLSFSHIYHLFWSPSHIPIKLFLLWFLFNLTHYILNVSIINVIQMSYDFIDCSTVSFDAYMCIGSGSCLSYDFKEEKYCWRFIFYGYTSILRFMLYCVCHGATKTLLISSSFWRSVFNCWLDSFRFSLRCYYIVILSNILELIIKVYHCSITYV